MVDVVGAVLLSVPVPSAAMIADGDAVLLYPITAASSCTAFLWLLVIAIVRCARWRGSTGQPGA